MNWSEESLEKYLHLKEEFTYIANWFWKCLYQGDGLAMW